MAVSDLDYKLLQEELRCLSKRFKNTLSTAGGSVGPITSPGSSVYPNEYFQDCNCVSVETQTPNPVDVCPSDPELGGVGLGDLGNSAQLNKIGGVFSWDPVNGVFYKSPGEDIWENRNTGLSSTNLNHGTLDYWWYRKASPREENAVIWSCGDGFIRYSNNAGTYSWKDVTPFDSDDVQFIQIASDPFNQNYFYALATTGNNCLLYKTVDNGTNWTVTDLTDYNSVTKRIPIWLSVGSRAGFLWITTWGDNKIRLLKVSNSESLTASEEFDLGACLEIDFYRKVFVAMPKCALDNPNIIYIYGRINDNNLGVCHILKTENSGTNWSVVENSFGSDWVGSLKIGIDNQISYIRNSA